MNEKSQFGHTPNQNIDRFVCTYVANILIKSGCCKYIVKHRAFKFRKKYITNFCFVFGSTNEQLKFPKKQTKKTFFLFSFTLKFLNLSFIFLSIYVLIAPNIRSTFLVSSFVDVKNRILFFLKKYFVSP